ncbi:hypothetical protein [Corallococcus carmarthensis]|uniref:Lipoprotein n=1 Tax=Corallococcus carmarthensis TaxID=2316728 RepID=A0A3A8JYC4_9BACT|nr:hypothetical protein [Corallococcus carmarthensis]NOK22665.1 hypothetical protein [Corallococcus carmarthensis]RKH00923.1 hypothetical protein D7X32_22000 [Corallococcus carmarthensis]
MFRHTVQWSVLASALFLGACNTAPTPTQEPTPAPESTQSVRAVESKLSQIELEWEGPTPLLESDMEAGNEECDSYYNWCDGTLDVYGFPWSSTQAPTLSDAVESVFALMQQDPREQSRINWQDRGTVPFSTLSDTLFFFDALDPHLLTELGNGTEQVQIRYFYSSYLVAPGAHDWNHLFIVLFPQSHRIAVFNLVNHEI